MKTLEEWKSEGNHLPDCLKDFHDQKRIFRYMGYHYEKSAKEDGEPLEHVPNCVDGHVYAMDWFLWFMASKGYTLQKCRSKQVEFESIEDVLKTRYYNASDI